MGPMRRAAPLLACVLLLAACRTSARGYFSDRLEDTVDMVPFSVATGPGFYVGARATAIAGTGIGWAKTHRAGWRRRKAWADHPAELVTFRDWREREKGVLLAWDRSSDPEPGAGNLGVVVPAIDEDDDFGYRPYVDLASALDAELEAHLFYVGLRIGASPVQIVDWLLGWTTLDILGDDRENRFVDTVRDLGPTEDAPRASRPRE